MNIRTLAGAALLTLLLSSNLAGQGTEAPAYRNPALTVEERVGDLISRMTLEEKIGQLNMPVVYEGELGETQEEKLQSCRELTAGRKLPGIGPLGGFFTLANSGRLESAERQAEVFNELQKVAVEETRLGIPLLQIEEGTHGLMCAEGTIFPEGLALGSSWNPELFERIYSAAAVEARAVGIHLLNTLVVEPFRDPRLGRSQEGYTEDPFLSALFAGAIVRGMQKGDISRPDSVIASLCHFPGQSEPVSGLERGAMEISTRKLWEVFLPPWVEGLKEEGALSVMATYPAIDGIPVHGSPEILTDLLRYELDFEGIVLSEGSGISTLLYEGLARNQQEAGILSLKAGVDVGISYEPAYLGELLSAVREGKFGEEFIDRSLERILRLKVQLGLFENPYVDPAQSRNAVPREEHRRLALQAAREGIVLLKNEGELLPLRKDLSRVAVIGPNADHVLNQLGDYTQLLIPQEVATVLEGIRESVSPQTEVTYVRGCDVTDTGFNEIEKAREEAAGADVAIVVLGENEWRAPQRQGTSGEAFDSATLELTGLQLELVQAVEGTGTPTVVILINGRPLATRWIAGQVPALLEAWTIGERGGVAVAEVLFGDVNPSGRLPVTVPRHAGQLPVYYNYPKSKEYWIEEGWGVAYADLSPKPLYPFGFGLSYTRFEYSDLSLSESVPASGKVSVGLTLTNTGSRAGQEVVQIYVRDRISSLSTPVQELEAFEKVHLEAGQSRRLELQVPVEQLALVNREGVRVVEPGEFEVRVGASAEDIRLEGTVVVRGE